MDVILRTNNKTLQWTNILQPSDLPPDFKIVHNYNISYQVHVYYEDGVSSVNVPRNYFNILNKCEKQNFTVQTVINDEIYSDNSSVISFEGKYLSLQYFDVLREYCSVILHTFLMAEPSKGPKKA